MVAAEARVRLVVLVLLSERETQEDIVILTHRRLRWRHHIWRWFRRRKRLLQGRKFLGPGGTRPVRIWPIESLRKRRQLDARELCLGNELMLILVSL